MSGYPTGTYKAPTDPRSGRPIPASGVTEADQRIYGATGGVSTRRTRPTPMPPGASSNLLDTEGVVVDRSELIGCPDAAAVIMTAIREGREP